MTHTTNIKVVILFYVLCFNWVLNEIPSSFDNVDKIYINNFKFNLKDYKYLRYVKENVKKDGFTYARHIVSTFHSFKKENVEDYSVTRYNLQQLESLQIRLSSTVLSIEQDFERRIFANAYKEMLINGRISLKTKLRNQYVKNQQVQPTQKDSSANPIIYIAVADARFQTDHPNLRNVIARSLCYDFIDEDTDPSIDMNNENLNYPNLYHTLSHGTKCMGRIGADGFNGCDQGVAPNVKLVGLRMITDFGRLTDERESLTLSYKLNDIHVYSCSYGIQDNKGFFGPLSATEAALRNGVERGRECRGRIFVYPSGNGDEDNCNADGYANSIYTITIASVKKDGNLPENKEICASAIAAAYGEGFTTTDLYGECSNLFDGASAATAVAAGYIGEILTINPYLSKRDIEHIIVKTSTKHPKISWRENGAGLLFNDQIGFGQMDLTTMKQHAANWQYLPRNKTCIISDHTHLMTKKGLGEKININKTIKSNSCSNTVHHVRYIEHVQVMLLLKSSNIAAVSINLISPMNTSSPILTKMKIYGNVSRNFNWTFMSVHFWGEDPYGIWTVVFNSDVDNEYEVGVKQIVFHGTGVSISDINKPQQCDTEDIKSDNTIFTKILLIICQFVYFIIFIISLVMYMSLY